MEAISETVVGSTQALSVGELQTLINVLHSVNGRMAIPADHLIYTRLLLTFSCNDEQNEIAHALRLVAMLSAEPSNVEPCLGLITEAGAQVESYIALRNNDVSYTSNYDNAGDEVSRDLLIILLRVSRYELSGVDVLEAFSGNATKCMRAVCSLLRSVTLGPKPSQVMDVPGWEEDISLVTATARMAYEMVTYETYFTCVAGASTVTDQPMAQLAAKYATYVGNLSNFCATSPLLDLFAAVLDTWFEVIEAAESVNASRLLPFFERSLSHVLMFVTTCLTVTTKYSAIFKKHLASNTVLIQNVVLPSMLFELNLIEGNNYNPEQFVSRHVRLLLLIIKTMSLVTNKVKVFRPWLRKYPFLGTRMLRQESVMQTSHKIEYIALITRLVINAELTDSVPSLLDVRAALQPIEQHRLALRLSNPRETMYPVNVFCDSYSRLRDLFQQHSEFIHLEQKPIKAVGSDAASRPKFSFTASGPTKGFGQPSAQPAATFAGRRRAQPGKGRSSMQRRMRRRKVQSRYVIIKKRNPTRNCEAGVNDSGHQGDWEESSSEDEAVDEAEVGEEMKTFTPKPTAVLEMKPMEKLQATDAAAAEQRMQPPPATSALPPTASLALASKASALPPLQGAPPPQPVQADPNAPGVVHLSNGVVQHHTLAEDQVQEVVHEDESSDEDEAAAEPAPDVSPAGVDLRPWRQAAPPGVPTQYLCALSHKLIGIPVLAPSGDVYDKETIVKFLRASNNTCPMTGEELYASDLFVDDKFKRELDAVRWNYVS